MNNGKHSQLMPANLNLLIPEFRAVVEELLQNCKSLGVEMIPYETLRLPLVQAKYWKQSKAVAEVERTIIELNSKGAEFIAECLLRAELQNGPLITNALPGFSWHQWGEAVDCYWRHNGKIIWDSSVIESGVNGYEIFANEAKKLNLTSGFFWTFKDATHIQYQHYASPSSIYSLCEIEEVMKYCYS